MSTLSCGDDGQRLPLASRFFTWSQQDPNNWDFCAQGVLGCINPVKAVGQNAVPANDVLPDNTKVNVNGSSVPLNCQNFVDWKLNEGYDPAFAPSALYPIGCGVSTNSTTGRRETGCTFGAQQPKFAAPCPFQNPINFFVVHECQFTWTCPIVTPDESYKAVCCNAVNVENMGSQTDPYTGLPFNPRNACAPGWCLEDPDGACLDLFNASCSTVTACNRHAFLTENFPVQTNDPLVQTITVNPSVKQGLQCYNWNEVTKNQAAQRSQLSNTSFAPVVNARVTDTVNIVKAFCANPETKGNGECACINAYTQVSAQFAQSLAPEALTFQYSTDSQIPMMLVQSSGGGYRRVDAFCQPSSQGDSTRPWLDPITYTDANTVTRTISNVCSVTDTFWFNSPLEYTLPTMNPNRNLNSLTNFGDVVNSDDVLESFRNLGQNLNVSMPLHCWHPACTSPFFSFMTNPLVFLDLYAFTQTCPNVCYMNSGGDIVNILADISATQSFITINNQFQVCEFAGQNTPFTYQPFPFALPSGCQQLYLQVPVNFSDTVHITVTNPQLDISEELQSKTLFAFSNLLPLVAFHSASSITASIGPELIYKYSYTAYNTTSSVLDTIVLSVSVDTTGMSPFTSFQSEINLTDNSRNTQQIQVQVNVYPDGAGVGSSVSVSPFACGEVEFNTLTGLINCLVPCDCSFGSNSTTPPCQTGTFSLVDPAVAHTTGFTTDGDPIVRPLRNLLGPQFGTNPVLGLGPSAVALAQALRFG